MVALSEAPLVFIVDAEAVNCRLFDAKLTRNQEFRVLCATSGASAARLATEETFAVILWDMRMRETLSLLPRLRAFCPQAALLLTTTDDRPILPIALQRLDVTDILIKPLNLDTLLQRVRHAVNSPPLPPVTPSLEIVSVGQQIVLRRDTGICTTRVVAVGLDTFVVAAPPRVDAPADFTPGAFVRIVLPAEDAVYSFETTILERTETPIPQWEVAMPRSIQREQRRQFSRAVIQTAVTLSAQTPSETDVAIQAVARNISFGGLALISENALAPGTEVAFDLKQTGQENLAGFGRVVRATPRTSDASETVPKYDVVVEFTSLPLIARRQLRSLVEKVEE